MSKIINRRLVSQLIGQSNILRTESKHMLRSFSISSLNQNTNLRFTDKHEWINLKNGDIGTVGISDYAQVELNIILIDYF